MLQIFALENSETCVNMSMKGKIGKTNFSSEIRVGGNMSKIGKKGNVAKLSRTAAFRFTTRVVQALHKLETNSIVLKGTADGISKAHSQLCFLNI